PVPARDYLRFSKTRYGARTCAEGIPPRRGPACPVRLLTCRARAVSSHVRHGAWCHGVRAGIGCKGGATIRGRARPLSRQGGKDLGGGRFLKQGAEPCLEGRIMDWFEGCFNGGPCVSRHRSPWFRRGRRKCGCSACCDCRGSRRC